MSLASASVCSWTLAHSCPVPCWCYSLLPLPQCPQSKTSHTCFWDVKMFLLPRGNPLVSCTLPWYSHKKGKNMFIQKTQVLERGVFILKRPAALSAASKNCSPAHGQLSAPVVIYFPKVTCRKIRNRYKTSYLDSKSNTSIILSLPPSFAFANVIPFCLQWHSCSTVLLQTKINRIHCWF